MFDISSIQGLMDLLASCEVKQPYEVKQPTRSLLARWSHTGSRAPGIHP